MLFAGCKYSYDKDLQAYAKKAAQTLIAAGVKLGYMGEADMCCAGRAYQMGFFDEFGKRADANIKAFKKQGVKTIVTPCSDCYHAFKTLYAKRGMNIEVLHITEYLDKLIKEKKIKFKKNLDMVVTYHDPCHLGRQGEPYTEGIRYKEVTAEEAGDYKHNVTLDDGRILMPLIIEWSSSEGNSVSELLAVMLANGEQTKAAGMQINQNVMSFDDLLNYMYRDASQGDQYGVKTYGMYNLATNFTAMYDQSFQFVTEESNPEYYAQGYNSNFTDSKELDELSMNMVYGVEAGDDEGYLKTWVDFIDEWNEYLPEVPLYSNVYYDVMNDKIDNLECNSLFDFQQAVVYATIG